MAPICLEAERLHFLFDLAVSLVQADHFVYKRKFLILKFIFNILLYNIRVVS